MKARLLFVRQLHRAKSCFYSTVQPNSTHPANLAKYLHSKIKLTGPITVAEYMREVLTNPFGGYYMHNDVFGQTGDFVTSPELGQVFGELVAIWFLNEWSKAGSPKPVQLVELGPGRGTLCQDILRVFSQFRLLESTSVHLVEVSPHLSELQAKRLCTKSEVVKDSSSFVVRKGVTQFGEVPIFWYRHLDDVPKEFTLLVAHEFFDALPIHKFERTKDGYREVLVDVELKKEGLRFVLSKNESLVGRAFINKGEARAHVEVSPESLSLVQKISNRLEYDGGLCLIADYGHDGSGTDTFRAFKKHKQHDPLIEPGSADLTADVDFGAFKEVAVEKGGVLAFGPVFQRDFLLRLGMEYRINVLKQKAKEEQVRGLEYGFNMMIDPQQMGHRFKFLALVPKSLEKIITKYPLIGFH